MSWPILDIRINKAEDHKDLTVQSKDNKLIYSSVLLNPKQLESKWKWKWIEYPEHIHNNAVKSFKFFVRDWKDKLIYNMKDAMKLINSLKKDLSKENISVCYLDGMGKWYDGEIHFIDYLWNDARDIIESEFKNTPRSYIMTDDIYVLDSLRFGELTFKHNILKKDIKQFQSVICKYNSKYRYNSSKSITIRLLTV